MVFESTTDLLRVSRSTHCATPAYKCVSYNPCEVEYSGVEWSIVEWSVSVKQNEQVTEYTLH